MTSRLVLVEVALCRAQGCVGASAAPVPLQAPPPPGSTQCEPRTPECTPGRRVSGDGSLSSCASSAGSSSSPSQALKADQLAMYSIYSRLAVDCSARSPPGPLSDISPQTAHKNSPRELICTPDSAGSPQAQPTTPRTPRVRETASPVRRAHQFSATARLQTRARSKAVEAAREPARPSDVSEQPWPSLERRQACVLWILTLASWREEWRGGSNESISLLRSNESI